MTTGGAETTASHPRGRSFRVVAGIAGVQVKLAALALLAMMLVTTADVVMRYAFNKPIRGNYDFVEAMLVVVVFNGLSAGFLARSHIVIDLVDHFGPRRLRDALMRVGDFCSLAALLVLFYAMAQPARQAYDYGDTKLELGLPIYVLWIVAGIGMAGTVLSALAALLSRSAPGAEGGARE